MRNSTEYILDVMQDILPDLMGNDNQALKRIEANLFRIIIHANILANRNKELEADYKKYIEMEKEYYLLKSKEKKFDVVVGAYKDLVNALRKVKTYKDFKKCILEAVVENKELNKKIDKVLDLKN